MNKKKNNLIGMSLKPVGNALLCLVVPRKEVSIISMDIFKIDVKLLLFM